MDKVATPAPIQEVLQVELDEKAAESQRRSVIDRI